MKQILHLAIALLGILILASTAATAQVGHPITHQGVTYTITSISPNEVEVSRNENYLGVNLNIPASVSNGGKVFDVTAIVPKAFMYNQTIEKVSIPSSVKVIGYEAFFNCKDFKTIEVDASNQYYSSLNGVLFNKQRTELKLYPTNCGATYTIPNTVKTIGDAAFSANRNLTSVTIPNSVETIGTNAFGHSTALTKVHFGNSIRVIGKSAFYYCRSLAGSLLIPNSVETIEQYAFQNCEKLTSIVIGNAVKEIGGGAFSGCIGVTTLTLGNSIELIGKSAFLGLTAANTTLTIPNSVRVIGDEAFYDSGFSNVTIGQSVKLIGDKAFLSCPNLNGFEVDPANQYYASDHIALLNKERTRLIQFPGGYGASYTIPEGVSIIGHNAFYSGSLTSVTIPKTINNIGNHAFMWCWNLTTITSKIVSPGGVVLGTNALSVPRSCKLIVPKGKIPAYQAAEQWKAFKPIEEDVTFTVTLQSNEHGTIAIAEAVDLNDVSEGTTLTIIATPKNDQCKLVKLTANGKDILATKKFTVTAATVVVADFADHTSMASAQSASLKVYPNPAKDFVIVEGAPANAEIRLYSMDGRLLIIARTNADGYCHLDVSAFRSATYVLLAGDRQQRLSLN